MKLNKISFLAMAMAGVLVGCSDEQDFKYTEGSQSPGAYFASTSPKVVEVSDDATEVAIPINRINSTTASASVSASGDTELFTIPTSVSFSGDALTADLMIGYKATDLEYDKKYEITLTLADASNYGMAEYRFAIVRPAPIETIVIHEFEGPGEGASYTFSAMFSGTDTDLGVSVSWNTTTPDQKIYTIFPFGYWEEDDASDAIGLKIYVDESKTLPAMPEIERPEGCYLASVPLQHLFYIDDGNLTTEKTERDVCIEDQDAWMSRLFPDEYSGQYKGWCFFNPETGLFTLNVGYTMPYYDEGTNYYGEGIEYCQLPGYPDYSLDVVYEGFMTAANGRQSYAVIEVTTGPDFDEVRIVNIEGDDTETAVDTVMAGGMEYESVGPSETKSLRIPIEGSGTYTAIAMGVKDKDLVRTAMVQYTIGDGGVVQNKDWLSIGQCEYVDGWVLPGFQYNDGTAVNPYDLPYYVEIKEHKDHPGLYKLIAPYSQTNSPVGNLNEDPGDYDIIFNAEDPDFVYMEPQYSGFDFGSGQGGKETIYDLTGMYIAAGYTKEETLQKFNNKQNPVDEWSINDDGVIIFTPCIFDLSEEGEGYSWKAGYPTEVWLPGTFTPSESAARHIRRAANPPLGFAFNYGSDTYKLGKFDSRPLREHTKTYFAK